MHVVTGATGHMGRLVAEELARRGASLRLVVRDASRAPPIPGAEIAVADYGDADALARALQPGDRVFMVSMHEPPVRRVPLHRSFVDACARAGVGHVVYLSFLHAREDAVFLHARSHGATEAMLRASGVPWTAMRNGMYADDIPGWFDPDGVVREPGGDARMHFTPRLELAEAIAVALTTDGHAGKVYDVVADDAVSMAELAAVARDVTGDARYRYEPIDDDAWEQRWREDGAEDWHVESGRTTYASLRAGEQQAPKNDYAALVGQPAPTTRDLVVRFRDALPLTRR